MKEEIKDEDDGQYDYIKTEATEILEDTSELEKETEKEDEHESEDDKEEEMDEAMYTMLAEERV